MLKHNFHLIPMWDEDISISSMNYGTMICIQLQNFRNLISHANKPQLIAAVRVIVLDYIDAPNQSIVCLQGDDTFRQIHRTPDQTQHWWRLGIEHHRKSPLGRSVSIFNTFHKIEKSNYVCGICWFTLI